MKIELNRSLIEASICKIGTLGLCISCTQHRVASTIKFRMKVLTSSYKSHTHVLILQTNMLGETVLNQGLVQHE